MQTSPDRPRIVVLVSHVQLGRTPSRLAVEVDAAAQPYAAFADVSVVDRAFDASLEFARHIERSGGADVLVCAGATGAYLRKNLTRPVVLMRPNGVDLLRALAAGRRLADRVGVLNYRDVNDELQAIEGALDVHVRQGTYTTLAEAEARVRELAAAGCSVVIGSSMVTEIAEGAGLIGLLSLGAQAVRHALDDALALHRSARAETARRRRLDTILEHLRDGVLAVNARGLVQSMNPAMAALLGVEPGAALGRDIDDVLPRSGLREVLKSGHAVTDRMLEIGRRSVLADLTPLAEDGALEGALLTVQEAEAVQRADRHIRVQARRRRFVARHALTDIVGDCPAMRQATALAGRYAQSASTVLVSGESGTGKELIAQGIHNASGRRTRPFVAINCGAFPETLLESELFGYEEGAFSGARRGGKPGLVEAAHTGTLFLDEIGDMPLPLQTRLLRVLQEREVLRLGGTEPTPVDVRVIAATHRELQQEVREGRFRTDLFYRINILRVHLPPLRERGDDVEALARCILAGLERSAQGRGAALLTQLLPHLRTHAWPGNVRELENMLERALLWWNDQEPAALAQPSAGLAAVLPELFEAGAPADAAPPDMRGLSKAVEIAYARQTVAECGGNLHRAADRLGVSRSTLWRRLRQAI
jgi:propionate catabolism operon transcriptional regulator